MKFKLAVAFALFLNCAHAMAFDHDHKAWTALLKQYVTSDGPVSQVDYVGLKKDRSRILEYTQTISAVGKAEYEKFTELQKMVFLINAYNAFTLQIVSEHYPVTSIKDISSLFKSTWKIKFIKMFGEEINLDQIEHENLRKNFREARVHFAVNCASVGCPALRAEAFTPDQLNVQLDEQARLFLRDTSRNKINPSDKTLALSMIFKWFHEDFEREGSSVQKFIARFISDDPKVVSDLKQDNFKVSYLDYNWSLNKR